MIKFIQQEASEKAQEIKLKADEEDDSIVNDWKFAGVQECSLHYI